MPTNRLYPRANVARPLSDFRQNYKGVTGNEQQVDQFDVKVDWNASAQDKLYMRYSRQAFESAPLATVMPLSFASAANNPFWGMAVNWNRIFGTSVVNDLLVGVNDSHPQRPDRSARPRQVEQRAGDPGDQVVRGLTNIRWGNDLTEIGSAETGTNNANLVYQVNERLTWLLGRHTLKFGGSWNYYQSSRPGQQRPERLHRVQRVQFHGRAVCRFPAGSGVAERPRLRDRSLDALQHRTSIYAADDFKIVDTLTLNLGMRWAYTSPFVEKTTARPTSICRPGRFNLPGRTATAARAEPFYNGWEPRVGVAYRMNERWVFRGGYGIAQYMEGTGANLRLPLNPPFFFESEVR